MRVLRTPRYSAHFSSGEDSESKRPACLHMPAGTSRTTHGVVFGLDASGKQCNPFENNQVEQDRVKANVRTRIISLKG